MLRAARDATKRQGDRGRAAASLHPPAVAVRMPSPRCFNDADAVIVADVYPAGEAPIAGVDKQALAAAINAHGHRHAIALPSPDKLAGDRAQDRPAGRLRRLSRRRQHHPMGLCAARRTRRARRRQPRERDGLAAEIARARARVARPLDRRRAARALHLVSRRRAGRGSVLAGRRGRPRLFPDEAAARDSGHGHRPRLQSHRPRRRDSRRGDSLGRQGVRRDRDDGRLPRDRRRGGARRAGRARRGRGGDRRARLPARRAGLDRRRAEDERRRARRRDARSLRRGARDRPRRREARLRPGRDGLFLSPQRSARRRDLHPRRVSGPPGRSAGDQGRDGAHHRRARSLAADSRQDRRLDVQEPAGPQGLAIDRRRRLPRPASSATRRFRRCTAISSSTAAAPPPPTSRRSAKKCAGG